MPDIARGVDTRVPSRDHGCVSATLPTGVVTFLFTDVEGSTKLLHELGDAYADALHEHRRLLRGAFAANNGAEVDTQGDAFFVAFGRASDAVAAAVDAQLALSGGPIRVRMGLHTGEPRLTDEGYVGLDVHKGARIAAVGHGGQVLLSQATRALVDADVRDLGPHRLKDLSVPERIFQLEIDGLPSEFPPLKTLEAGMRNLPAPRTSFVGRTDELASIDRMLDEPDCRLLTLVGPGGVGKTRLALEAAARRIDRYQHGVHFVPLVGVPAPDLLAPAVAESLQFQVDNAHSAIPARDQLVDFLRERATLLVLDNFEHLLDARDLLTEVIEQAPQVELLTTSRERLQVQSEWVLDVDGLANGSGNGHAGDSAAVRLFVDRARQVDEWIRALRQRAPARGACVPPRERDAARHRARGRLGFDPPVQRDRRRDRAEPRLPGDDDARRPGAAPQPPRRIRSVVATPLGRRAARVLALVGLSWHLRAGCRGRSGRSRFG